MILGTVKSFNHQKGWGFIQPDEGGADIFVHAKALNGLVIHTGQRVGCNTTMAKKGLRAVSVIVLLGDGKSDQSQVA
jgi:cold shock protein